jgi:hypothetical protein
MSYLRLALFLGADGQPSRPSHPQGRPQIFQPVLDRRNPAKIFLHVLLAHPTHGDHPAIAVGERDAKDAFGQEDTFGMMAERPVADVGQAHFTLVEKVVNRQVVFRLAAPTLDAGQGVVIRVRDGPPPFGC